MTKRERAREDPRQKSNAAKRREGVTSSVEGDTEGERGLRAVDEKRETGGRRRRRTGEGTGERHGGGTNT